MKGLFLDFSKNNFEPPLGAQNITVKEMGKTNPLVESAGPKIGPQRHHKFSPPLGAFAKRSQKIIFFAGGKIKKIATYL